ncbi:acetyl-CoA synthetase-like protein [Paraphaeosphaeria sporulosa]|uniref:Acetyl-CoA synthetase-like protein n=1 Tax=Paraphaeosphaeria sporulosa TaxID=1460663 RepID=A0A177C5E0_9PLEO|nr:acetyl-CoA synthetase-like protein [Paraphaeosphaeria sporulosa]OAG01988.1 acetyl-CoA synthetase-like protein [Paraphaeosphaeria sporulosa]
MAHLTQDHVQYLYDTFGELKVLDDIIQHRAADKVPAPILGYPKGHTADDYERFTGRQLDAFVDAAAKHFLANGLKASSNQTVAIYTPSNLDFVVTLFALSRIGYTVLCLSLRLAPIAIVNLLRQAGCSTMVHGYSQQIESMIQEVAQEVSLQTLHTPGRKVYEIPIKEPRFQRVYNRDEETNRVALVMHSSGSTGLPKPVFLSHKNVLCHPVQGAGVDNFGALPLYHMYGISTMLQAMYMRKIAYMFNQSLPMTADNLIAAIQAIRPQAIHTVPYALGLLAEQTRGVECLKACKFVTAASARTPDELGDRLVEAGVNLGVVYGTTECGLAGDTMRRGPGDNSWNYIRLYPNVRKFVEMRPVGGGQYECIYLRGHPGLSSTSLESETDGSWRSKDIFVPHSTVLDAWKYITRTDDRITLINGEKVLPLPIEGCIRENHLVREAVVIGIDRPIPGLLVFKSHLADQIPDGEYVDSIWPTIQDANAAAESFSQITKDMIWVFLSTEEYPRTDKNSIIRAQVYRTFAQQIDMLYARIEAQEGCLKLSLPAIEEFLRETFEDIVGASMPSAETDYFSAGVDSLRAIQMRRIIQKTLDLGGHELSPNVVYEYQSPKKLAQYLHSLRTGTSMAVDGEAELMGQLITDHSTFGEVAILTGATGSLGAHLLDQMISSKRFRKVYCFVRGGKRSPLDRVLGSLEARCIEVSKFAKTKIVALEVDLSLPDFGIGEAMMEKLRTEVTLIQHLAWPVNFNIPLATFRPHIAGLQNLLKLSLEVYRTKSALLFFCSSISTAANTPLTGPVPDEAIEDFNFAADTGYAKSKLVGEHIVRNATRAGARGYILRIGQIVGDTKNGVWNDEEFIPAMIRSALTMKMLPMLHEQCSWLPVDTLAEAMMELTVMLEQERSPLALHSTNPPIFFNMANPDVFSWKDLLAELKKAGLQFKVVRFNEWLKGLQASAERGNEIHNPAVKLIDYYRQHYSSSLVETNGFTEGTTMFRTEAAERYTTVLASQPGLIESGHIQRFVAGWRQKWDRTV